MRYEIYIEMKVQGILDNYFFNWYNYKIDGKFKPIRFSPYSQGLLWSTPGSGGFDLDVYAQTWSEIGNLTIT